MDAFLQLLSPAVSRISAREGRMHNGIAYCIVQVSLASGEEYRIEAYDKEAGGALQGSGGTVGAPVPALDRAPLGSSEFFSPPLNASFAGFSANCRRGAMQSTLERLSVYRCLSCGQVYFFALDVVDHKKEAGHQEFLRIDPDFD